MFKANIAILIILLSSYGKVETRETAIKMQDFDACFPLRSKFYTYTAFAKAIYEMAAIKIKIEECDGCIYKITRTNKRTGKQTIIRLDKGWNETWAKKKYYTAVEVDYGDFCSSKNGKTNKMELAALFAHMAHETRNGADGKFNDGLMLIKESDPHSDYIVPNLVYPATAGKKYYGRGPIQLSYNENYGFASDCIFGNQDILLKNPELVSSNAVIAFETAIYFWMTPQNPKPSAHDVMTGKWVPSAIEKQKGYKSGFGLTINIINGGLECNKGENLPQMKDRIGFYQHFLNQLKINDNNCACSCAQMLPYSG